MKIHFADSPYKVSADFKQKYIAEIENAHREVSKLLPFGSKHINFFVQPRTYDLIAETEDTGYTVNSEFVTLAFNPNTDKSLEHIKGTVFHEMNHAARYNNGIWHNGFIDNCIMEGLATVFAREYANYDALWGQYADEVTDWLDEILEQGKNIDVNQYMYRHSDGRRWIGYKVGTYIIDEAIKNSGKTVIELTKMECADILKLAKIDTTNYAGLEK